MLKFVLAGCCLDMFMGSQQSVLCLCWFTGLSVPWVFGYNRNLNFLLKGLFCISSALIFLCFFCCRMALFGCLTCAKPQGLLNLGEGFQTTQFILYIPFHIIQLFLLVLDRCSPLLRLAYVCGTLVVLKKGEFISVSLSFLFVYEILWMPVRLHWYIFFKQKFAPWNWVMPFQTLIQSVCMFVIKRQEYSRMFFLGCPSSPRSKNDTFQFFMSYFAKQHEIFFL